MRSHRGMIERMAVRKIAISLDPVLAQEITRAASEEKASVSQWLAEAARDRMRVRAAWSALAAYEEEAGALTEEEINAARRFWREA